MWHKRKTQADKNKEVVGQATPMGLIKNLYRTAPAGNPEGKRRV
jgi:hypothetical protein